MRIEGGRGESGAYLVLGAVALLPLHLGQVEGDTKSGAEGHRIAGQRKAAPGV